VATVHQIQAAIEASADEATIAILKEYKEHIENNGVEHAKMYAWLRKQHWTESPLCVVHEPREALKPGYFCPSGDWLDDFIRKYMK
jgi:hypothetical protein